MKNITELEIGTVVTDGMEYAIVRESNEAQHGKYYANYMPEFNEIKKAELICDLNEDQF